jgi:hypothetical protein
MQTITLPDLVEQTLKQAFGPDMNRAALEALAVEGYRTGRLTTEDVARILGLETPLAAHSWLAGRGEDANQPPGDPPTDLANLAHHLSEMTL